MQQPGAQIRGAAFDGLADDAHRQCQQLLDHRILDPLVIWALKDELERSRRSGRHRPAEGDLPADQVRQLESYMLEDVPEGRAAGHLVDQTARPRRRAVVFCKSRQELEQPRGEAWHIGGLPAGELLEVNEYDNDRLGEVRVWAPKPSHLFYSHCFLTQPFCYSTSVIFTQPASGPAPAPQDHVAHLTGHTGSSPRVIRTLRCGPASRRPAPGPA